MGIALLIRHGRSTANVEGVLAGRLAGVSLHDSGREQARELARAFQSVSPTSLHVSPLERTQETASLVFGERPRVISSEIVECDYGTWSGRKLDTLSDDPLWELLHRKPSATQFPGGESIPEVAQRVIDYVRRHAVQDGLHAFVTHADPIMMLVGHAAGAPLDAYQRINVEPCSLSALLIDGDRFGVISVNVPPSGASAVVESLDRWRRGSVGTNDEPNHSPV